MSKELHIPTKEQYQRASDHGERLYGMDPLQPYELSIEKTTKDIEKIDKGVKSLATAFHEDWRKSRLQDDGSFEPRVKKTKDEAWTESHGTDEVDIANTNYEDLPSDWQAENKAAAEVVLDVMLEHDGKVDLNDFKTRSEVGNTIHDAWLSRNEYARETELGVPYDQLHPAEQLKDLNQVVIAQEVFEQN